MNNSSVTLRKPLALLGAGLSLFAAIAATAQTTAPASGATEEKDSTVQLEKLIVTGSNIPTAADAVAVPVTVLARTDIEMSGIDTNMLELLQKRMPIFAGNGNLGVTNSNVGANSTYGGSQASLRNLSTLVLLNGRRLPESGTNARGGRSFVDVNQIPMAAIQTVEVLTDGASAVYGSDAVGGVINVKLRSDFEGAEFGGRYAFSTADGDYEEKSAYAVIGAKSDRASLTVSVSGSEITPLYQADRDFSSPITGRTATISGAVSQTSATFPTALLRSDLTSPSKAVPTGPAATAANLAALVAAGVYQTSAFQPIADSFDLSPLVTLTLESKKKAASLAGTYKLVPDKVDLFIEGLWSKSDSFSQLAAQPITATVPINSPYNPTQSSIFAAFRYVPAPRQFMNTGELHRVVTGLRGKLADRFQWEVGFNYNKNRLTNEVHNVLYAPNLLLAIAGGYDANGNAQVGGRYARVFRDFGAPPGLTTLAQYQAAVTTANSVVQPALDIFSRPAGVDPASIANIFSYSSSVFDAGLTGIDAKIAGSLFEWSPGSIDGAIGVSHVKETLDGMPDANSFSSGPTAGRWSGATFFNPFSKERTIKSAFAEVRIPIFSDSQNIPGFEALDFTAAYRYERYSDAGTSRVPKYGIRWRPFSDNLTVRATYSEAFSAPALFSLFGPTTQGFTATSVIPNVFGVNGQAQSRGGSNPNLTPSTADTMSFGVVYSPKALPGLTVSVDYIEIEQLNLVGSAGVTEILRSVNALGTASPYVAQVAIGNWPTNPDANLPAATPITTVGQLQTHLNNGFSANQIFTTDSLINIAGQQVEALDVSAHYELPGREFGRWVVGTTGTFFLSYKFQALPTQPYFQYAGHVTNGGTGAQGVVPGMRWYSTVAWSKGAWNAFLGHTFIDGVTDIGPGGTTFVSSTTLTRRPVESYTTVDAAVGYTFPKDASSVFAGLKLTFGINNISDEMPSLSPQAFNESNADVSTYNPVGRLYYLSASYKF